MCGIFGFAGHKLDDHAVARAIASMRHRGPDGSGTFRDDAAGVGLGHARLSIIDLSAGAQPLFSEDRGVALVCNGEIYDFERIREDLKAKGHVFRTGSDSEVIIHLYEQYGPGFVEHLRGEFAFLLYDAPNRKLLAVRDRFGIKPLFYHEDGGKFLFASEAKAIFATGLVRPKIDVHAVRDYMAAVIPDSIFEGVRAVAPGCMLTVDLATGRHEISQYWDLDLPQNDALPTDTPLEQHVRTVQAAFDEAVRLRMRADVPVGVYLSGGIDSSIVAAVAAKHFPGTLQVFNIEFPGDHAWNEHRIAKDMAAKIGADFHSIACDSDTLLRNTEDALWVSELPFANFHGVGKYLLSQLARKHVTVVLTGEGSDEVFLGYVCFQEGKGSMAHHIADKLKGRTFRVPRKVKGVIDALGFIPMPEHSLSLTDSGRRVTARIFNRRQRTAVATSNPLDVLKRRIKRTQTDGNSHARKVQYFWIKSMLAPYLLCMLGDRAEMGHSIEGRTPFLDHYLFDTARGIPDEVKIRNGVEKHVLREAFKDDLTPELYNRGKWPYSAPPMCMRRGLSPELDRLLDRYVTKEAIARADIFSWFSVRAMLFIAQWLPFRFLATQSVHAGLVLVLTIQILHELFVERFDETVAQRATGEHAQA